MDQFSLPLEACVLMVCYGGPEKIANTGVFVASDTARCTPYVLSLDMASQHRSEGGSNDGRIPWQGLENMIMCCLQNSDIPQFGRL